MLEYHVEGQYISSDAGRPIKTYETKIVLQEKELSHARCIIQNVLIYPKLQEEIEDFVRWRTCEVFDGEPYTPKEGEEDPEINEELEQLAIEASENGVMPVTISENVSIRGKLKALREAVFKNRAAKKKAKQKEDLNKKSQGVLVDAD